MRHLENQKFGKLLVLRDSKQRQKREILWECQCDCGEIKLIRTSHLTSGAVTSCGKYDCKYLPRIKNIKNQQFENFIVLDFVGQTKKRSAVWNCKCLKCNQIYELTERQLITNIKCKCEKNIISRGEEKIKNILLDNNIRFEMQKTFKTCQFFDTKQLAKFDFYLPDYNLLIEYDGEQHFNNRKNGWNTIEKFNQTKIRDSFKNQWCKDNNIPLIRIPYWHYQDLKIEDLLKNSQFLI